MTSIHTFILVRVGYWLESKNRRWRGTQNQSESAQVNIPCTLQQCISRSAAFGHPSCHDSAHHKPDAEHLREPRALPSNLVLQPPCPAAASPPCVSASSHLLSSFSLLASPLFLLSFLLCDMPFDIAECNRIEIYSADGTKNIDFFQAPIASAAEVFAQLTREKKLDEYPPPSGQEWTTLQDAHGTKTLWNQQVVAGKYKIVASNPIAPAQAGQPSTSR